MRQVPIVRVNYTKTDNYIIEQKVPEMQLKSKHHKVRGKILAANFSSVNEALEYITNHKYQLVQN